MKLARPTSIRTHKVNNLRNVQSTRSIHTIQGGRASTITPFRANRNQKHMTQRRFTSTESAHVPEYLLQVPAVKVTTLKNGMRVATEETGGETATVGVFVDAGSVYEDEKTNGVAHFLEHMAFKGTKNRSRVALETEIENMGATLNAYTSREQTVYYAKTFKKDTTKAVDILADIITNSTFDKDSIEHERGTILREMEEVEKEGNEVLFDNLHAAAFQGHALSRTILGPEKNIKSITQEDLVKYIQTHYTGPRMVLAAAGAVNHEQMVDAANKAFASIPSENKFLKDTRPVPWTGSMINHRDDTWPHANIAIGVQAVGWTHPDYYTFLVIQNILGNWEKEIGGGKNLSSRLCEELAMKELVDSYSTFYTTYGNTGIFGSQFIVPEDKMIYDAVEEIMYEWNRIGKWATEREVERAKNRIAASTLLSIDGTQQSAEEIGRHLLVYGRRIPLAETYLRIQAITVDDVKRVAREYMEDVDPAVVSLGTTASVPDYNRFRGLTYWMRW